MARITALLGELETALKTIYPSITFGFGEKDLPRADSAPPRVVWIPTTTKHGAAEKQVGNPRCLRTREVTVVAHCWASADGDPRQQYDACEDLVHNLIVKLHKSGWGSMQFGGEEWAQSDHAAHGHAALVTFSVKVPVQEQTYLTAQPTTLVAETVGSVAGDSNVDWGET